MIPLPRWKANPLSEEDAFYQEGSHVMAPYPQTSHFHKKVVEVTPDTPSEVLLTLTYSHYMTYFILLIYIQ